MKAYKLAWSTDVIRVTECKGHATSMAKKIIEYDFGEETCKHRPRVT
jgi:hypothetical protein